MDIRDQNMSFFYYSQVAKFPVEGCGTGWYWFRRKLYPTFYFIDNLRLELMFWNQNCAVSCEKPLRGRKKTLAGYHQSLTALL